MAWKFASQHANFPRRLNSDAHRLSANLKNRDHDFVANLDLLL
jgi:hypothetical protein